MKFLSFCGISGRLGWDGEQILWTAFPGLHNSPPLSPPPPLLPLELHLCKRCSPSASIFSSLYSQRGQNTTPRSGNSWVQTLPSFMELESLHGSRRSSVPWRENSWVTSAFPMDLGYKNPALYNFYCCFSPPSSIGYYMILAVWVLKPLENHWSRAVVLKVGSHSPCWPESQGLDPNVVLILVWPQTSHSCVFLTLSHIFFHEWNDQIGLGGREGSFRPVWKNRFQALSKCSSNQNHGQTARVTQRLFYCPAYPHTGSHTPNPPPPILTLNTAESALG